MISCTRVRCFDCTSRPIFPRGTTFIKNTEDGYNYEYGKHGKLTSDGITTYTYGVENVLISTECAHKATLYYAPKDRLYRAAPSSGNATDFLYSGDQL